MPLPTQLRTNVARHVRCFTPVSVRAHQGASGGEAMCRAQSSVPKRIAARVIAVAVLLALSAVTQAAGVPLLDAAGGAHGSAKVVLGRGIVQLKITGLARLPAAVGTFTAHEYKAYLVSTADPAVEIYLTDVYPDARQRAVRKVVLGGDVSQMGLNRVVVTAFSKDGQGSADLLTAAFAP